MLLAPEYAKLSEFPKLRYCILLKLLRLRCPVSIFLEFFIRSSGSCRIAASIVVRGRRLGSLPLVHMMIT